MARQQRARSSKSSGKGKRPVRLGRILGWVVAALVVVAVLALPVYRWWWRHEDASAVQRGLALLEAEGCTGCHREAGGALRWRADGSEPPSLVVVRDAILNGRPAAGDMLHDMPAYGGRLRMREWQDAAAAVGALTGLLGIPEDQELAAGHDIAVQMGCFSCHDVLGAGGVANPGSLKGRVPGFYGPDFAAAQTTGLEEVLREGSVPSHTPVPGLPGPVLTMPSYGERLDSTELDLLVRYLVWLHENPPSFS